MIVVIIPPPPSSSIPQPSLLEEPPIPVGLKFDLEPQQQYPSISLVLPTKSESTDNQKTVSGSNNTDDTLATLSQQEELSVKGIFHSIKRLKNVVLFHEF
jgi:hypothetical protein